MSIRVLTSITNYIIGVTSQLKKTKEEIANAIQPLNTKINTKVDISAIPTKTSDLTNDSNFASDSSYVHTDNNFTNSLKTNLESQSGTNTGDETISTIKTKLGITTLSGSNTGDQDLSGLVPKTTTVNGHALSGNIAITTTDLSLNNVTNDAQLKANQLSTDGTLAGNSDTLIPSQKAVKTYSDTKPTISSGTTAPTSTPAKIGDVYIDTTNYKNYTAKGASSSSDWIKQNGSYVLTTYSSAVNSPADAQTLYFGQLMTGTTASATVRRMYIPRSGTISAVYGCFQQTAGTSEASTLYLRVNNTTDYLISNSITHATSATVIVNSALSVAVPAGDYIEFKWVTPTWATNPTSVYMGTNVLVDL